MPHKATHVSTHALGVVAGAAIPAAVIGSLALPRLRTQRQQYR